MSRLEFGRGDRVLVLGTGERGTVISAFPPIAGAEGRAALVLDEEKERSPRRLRLFSFSSLLLLASARPPGSVRFLRWSGTIILIMWLTLFLVTGWIGILCLAIVTGASLRAAWNWGMTVEPPEEKAPLADVLSVARREQSVLEAAECISAGARSYLIHGPKSDEENHRIIEAIGALETRVVYPSSPGWCEVEEGGEKFLRFSFGAGFEADVGDDGGWCLFLSGSSVAGDVVPSDVEDRIAHGKEQALRAATDLVNQWRRAVDAASNPQEHSMSSGSLP